jgi:hypothetical protein
VRIGIVNAEDRDGLIVLGQQVDEVARCTRRESLRGQ